MSSSLLQHIKIRGVQPSKRGVQQVKQKTLVAAPRLTNLQKNIQKITSNKKKTSVYALTNEYNNMMDQRCFRFFMDHCVDTWTHTQVPINTQECTNLLNKHNVEFINERTQEISNAKVLITTKTNRKKNNATFLLQLPMDYCEMLILYLLIKIDFGTMQIEFSKPVGRSISKFLQKSKTYGFRYYFDFIKLNKLHNRFIVVRC